MGDDKPLCRTTKPNSVHYPKPKKERSVTGGYEYITRFSDGSLIRHSGGPCEEQYYDQYGEEC